jgi:hypothetical protein
MRFEMMMYDRFRDLEVIRVYVMDDTTAREIGELGCLLLNMCYILISSKLVGLSTAEQKLSYSVCVSMSREELSSNIKVSEDAPHTM